MARNPARVARGERGIDANGDPQLGFDEALVGGGDEQAVEVDIDPSERDNNPFLGTEDDEDWDLPEDKKKKTDEPSRRETEQREQRREDPDDDDEEDMRLAYDEDAPEQRGGRRARRNRSRRGALDRAGETIAQLEARLARSEQVLSGLMGGQFNLSARDVDQRIQYHQNALDRADMEIAKAIKESDGDTAVALQRERDKISQGLWQLQGQKRTIEEHARRMAEGGEVDGEGPRQPQLSPAQRQMLEAQDRQYGRMRDVFLERYTWFDPDEGDDPDHDFVKRLDRKLVREGFQRHQEAFWHEMERRMNRAGFRPDGGRNMNFDDDDDEDLDRRPRREFRSRRETNGDGRRDDRAPRRANLPPTGRVHSQSRPGRGEPAFQMSDEQVDLLRQEGLLENNLSESEQAKKDRIMTKWRRGAQALAASRR